MRKFRRFLRSRLFSCALLSLLCLAGCALLIVWLPRFLAPVALLERAFSLAAALYVASRRTVPEKKLPCLILLLLPWAGALFVFLFGIREEAEVPVTKLREEEGLFGAASCLAEQVCGMKATTARAVRYFSVGREMYESLLSDLKAAERRIWLEYYILAEGKFWDDVLAVLLEKAKIVDVRILCDGFGSALTLPHNFQTILKKYGIAVKIYRPPRFQRGFSRRDHKKLAIIDDVVYTGGVNLADEYIGEKLRFGHWKDTAVRIEGASAFCALFLQTWGTKNSYTPENAGTIPCLPLADMGKRRLFRRLFPLLFLRAERQILLFTPYLSLDGPTMSALKAAASAGVDVRLMIPHRPDKRAVFFLTRAYARELTRAGVQVREYTAGFLHAKSCVIDGEYALVSSCNLDFRSFYEQEECGALVRDEALARAMMADFQACWEQGTGLKRVGRMLDLAGRVCMLFAPLT